MSELGGLLKREKTQHALGCLGSAALAAAVTQISQIIKCIKYILKEKKKGQAKNEGGVGEWLKSADTGICSQQSEVGRCGKCENL